MRRAHRLDSTHAAIKAQFEARGAVVQSLAGLADGVPDLIVGYQQRTALVEVKDGSKPPSKRKLTPDQVDWMTWWRGSPVLVIGCVEDVPAVLEAMT